MVPPWLSHVLFGSQEANKSGGLNETISALWKCLHCNAVFPYEEHRFEGSIPSCVQCLSNQTVQLYAKADIEPPAPVPPATPVQAPVERDVQPPSASSPEVSFADVAACVAQDTAVFDCRSIDHERKLVCPLINVTLLTTPP